MTDTELFLAVVKRGFELRENGLPPLRAAALKIAHEDLFNRCLKDIPEDVCAAGIILMIEHIMKKILILVMQERSVKVKPEPKPGDN